MENRPLMMILLMAVIVIVSAFSGAILIDRWSGFLKTVWCMVGGLPLAAWVTNIRQIPIAIELQLVWFFAGVVAGLAVLSATPKLANRRKVYCALCGFVCIAASLVAGVVAVALYYLP
jgi:peptidoglycan/LPS O-acetylase OafA/YrhL